MAVRQRALRTTVTTVVIAAVATALALIGAPAASIAGPEAALTTAGAALDGSVQGSKTFSVSVDAPEGATVRFRLDGVYLGLLKSGPYVWNVSTGDGEHELDARWDDDGRQQVEADFLVAGTGSGSGSGADSGDGTGATADPTPPSATPPVSPPATGGGTGRPGASTGSVTSVSTTDELTAALRAASPGDTIALADGTYTGEFEASASGTAAAPITLSGSRAAVLTTGSAGSGYGLHVTGSHWKISGLSVTHSGKGIVLDGSVGTVIDNVDVGQIGDEAIHFRSSSSDGAVTNSNIHDTGLSSAGYGEGIYIGSANSNWASVMGSSSTPDESNNVLVSGNHISNTTAEGIDVKEGTTNGTISGNVFTRAGYSGANFADSWVDVKGNGYEVTGNSGTNAVTDAFQVHTALPGWGDNNVFSDNTVIGGVPGYDVWIQSGASGNAVTCTSSVAKQGLTNGSCLSK